MGVKNVLHMNAGDGVTSYANNSGLQKVLMSKSLPVLDETLKDMFNDHLGLPKCFKMVDLGCSSGPNALLATSYIMDKIGDWCRENNINEIPEFEVFMNDLPDNDFNNLFKLLLHENGEERKNCFIYGLPGSFYSRLLPKKSIDLAYSFSSIHWLSQVPEGLTKKNKENVFLTVKSPPAVYEAYAKQYQRDFCMFLRLRAEEIIPGGRMVLTFVSRSVEDPSIIDDYATYTLLAKILLDMVAEGLVKMDDLYSFNVPIYTPHGKEVEAAIHTEGSFSLEKMDVFRVRWDANGSINQDEEDQQIFYKRKSGKIVADCFRAFMEPMLVSHFGSFIMDDLFRRYEKEAPGHLTTHKSTCINIVSSLKRR